MLKERPYGRDDGMNPRMKTYERIYAVIKQIPAGSVATYGLIAQIEGTCTPRMIGYALFKVKPEMHLPWHRVINSRGKISLSDPEAYQLQKAMLEHEGIVFIGDRVDLKKYLWQP